MKTPEDEWVGRTIDGRYRVLNSLGDGGMGTVYEAEHLGLGKRVALKVIRAELVRDDEVRKRFEREARATAAIEHPHVAAAMDSGRLPDGGAYLVVQLVQGISLRKRVEAGPLAWREACAIGAQIADALAAIHARGFVHRDLTAENVLLTSNEDGSPFVHVLDLGVAGVSEDAEGKRLTQEGHIVGTPGYMSPEQALGRPTDPRTDLYSLGVLLWEMCSGRTLWGTRELTQVVASQLTEDPPRIPQLSSATAPDELARLIANLLARSPTDRPSDAAAVRDTLRRFQTMSPVAPVIRRFGAPAAVIGGSVAVGMTMLVTVIFVSIALFGDDPQTVAKRAGARENVEAAPSQANTPLSPIVQRLVDGRYRRDRRAAARELRSAAEGQPAWAIALADLELGSGCVARRSALSRLEQLAEPASLPALRRWQRQPRTGCGRGRRSDCYACIRDDIDRTYQAVEARAPEH